MKATETAVGRPSSILVYLSGALGDTLLAYPALSALRSWAPGAVITIVGRPAYLIWAADTRLVDMVIDSDSALGARLISGDAGSLPGTPQLAVIWSSVAETIAQGLLATGTPAVLFSPPRSTETRHQARYLLDCLRPIDVPQVLHPAPMPVVQGLPDEWTHALSSTPRPIILIHPGAGACWKRWPLEQYIQLGGKIREAGRSVRWSFGPAEQDLRAQARARGVPDSEIWPEVPLMVFARLLARCDLLISADCGVAHLAALLRVPQVTVFGPTDPRRWRPLSRLARPLQAPALCGGTWPNPAGRDAMHRALQRCSPPDVTACRCLAALSPEVVFEACSALLQPR